MTKTNSKLHKVAVNTQGNIGVSRQRVSLSVKQIEELSRNQTERKIVLNAEQSIILAERIKNLGFERSVGMRTGTIDAVTAHVAKNIVQTLIEA